MPDLPWYVYAMLLAPLGLILFAAIYKSLQVRAASEWPSTPGKVVVSNSQVRQVRVLDDQREDGHRFEPRNFANIVYQYSVSGQRLTNNRVSIGEDRGNFGVAETIARYPVGAAVTVYYNSLHPREAVLERNTPKGWWGCLGIGIAIALAIVFGSVFGLNQLTEFIATRIANPKLSPPVVVFAAFGSVVALFALAMRRQASLARKWPVVSGTIRMSDVEQYRAASTHAFARGPVMYRRQVAYAYRYDNIAYSSVQASLATGLNPTSGWLARKFTTAYQDGASVNVYVNPVNPSEATLNPRAGAGLVWILWLVALAFWMAAYYTARAA
jgi:F0F1-type ATP synthase membrane subunit c/vacuolar-type H+-ATPase subunit K